METNKENKMKSNVSLEKIGLKNREFYKSLRY